MIYNELDFKKLGFKNIRGDKNVIEASAEIVSGQYITIQLSVIENKISFLGIQVQGAKADEKRKEYLNKYSLQEIYKLFSDY